MTDAPEHNTTLAHNALDKLAALVGQDRATQAVALADNIKQHIQDALKVAGEHIAEVTDPAVFAEVEQLKQTILNRDSEIAQLNGIIDQLKAEAPAPSPLAEVIESDPVVEPVPAAAPVEEQF